jgi:hypothetical protein
LIVLVSGKYSGDVGGYRLEFTHQDHSLLAAKSAPFLTSNQVQTLLALPSFEPLLKIKPAACLGQVINSFNDIEEGPQVYFRLLRPGMPGCHKTYAPPCDYCFDLAQNIGFGSGKSRRFAHLSS